MAYKDCVKLLFKSEPNNCMVFKLLYCFCRQSFPLLLHSFNTMWLGSHTHYKRNAQRARLYQKNAKSRVLKGRRWMCVCCQQLLGPKKTHVWLVLSSEIVCYGTATTSSPFFITSAFGQELRQTALTSRTVVSDSSNINLSKLHFKFASFFSFD